MRRAGVLIEDDGGGGGMGEEFGGKPVMLKGLSSGGASAEAGE